MTNILIDKASPDDPTELSFKKGDILHVVERKGNWWQARNSEGATGIIPSNYVSLFCANKELEMCVCANRVCISLLHNGWFLFSVSLTLHIIFIYSFASPPFTQVNIVVAFCISFLSLALSLSLSLSLKSILLRY